MKRAIVTFLVGCVAVFGLAGATQAGDFYRFSAEAFKAAQDANQTVLVEIDAGWCPVCARQRPIIDKLTSLPDYRDVKIMVIDFDSDKFDVRGMKADSQSTLIMFHGATEIGRLVGETDRDVIEKLFAQAKG